MKMYLIKIITVFVFLTSICLSNGGSRQFICPRFCKCDSYLLLNRAQCSSKKLISAEVDLSNQVQILDLSYNDITTVDNKCFGNFHHLKYLNLSNNALHTIDWNAFSKLRQLTEIDLSYNRLENLDERLFAKNRYLNRINLEGNKLQTLQNKPFLNNPFLSELTLKKSQLNLLQPQYFAGLKSLKILDLSENLLNNFNLEDFEYVQQLQKINLTKNFMKCNQLTKSKLQHLERQGIKVAMDECLIEKNAEHKENTKMFERIVMTPSPSDAEDDALSHKLTQWRLNLDLEESSSEDYYDGEFESKEILGSLRTTSEWLRFAPDVILCNKQNFVLCQEYRTCLQDLNKSWHEKRIFKEQCSLSDIKFAFIMGISIGISAIVLILSCALYTKRWVDTKRTSSSPSHAVADLPDHTLARPTARLPPQVRRQPRRRTAHSHARSMVRYDGPVGENFLSRLFGRPARHQYYRTINQNTATLIRRLSQSNLFSNRLSQHYADRQSSVAEASNAELQQTVSPESSPSTSATRSETPPPSYGDIVKRSLASDAT